MWANERIISLSPSITEIVFALGKGNNLVGVSSYSLYPKEAQNLPIVGGYENPNIEKIIALRPTIVVGQTFNKQLLNKLKIFNIKTLSLNLKRLDTIKESIEILSKSLETDSFKKLIRNIDDAIKSAPKSKKPHSVMIVYGLREDLSSGNYIAGHNIFFEDIIEVCGNTNAYKQEYLSQPVLSYENIIAINPDQIIIMHSLATGSSVDVQKALKAWISIPTTASNTNQIDIINENYLHIPSHRVALTIKKLCSVMND
jgi:iron complex transport system substrate-binding protein